MNTFYEGPDRMKNFESVLTHWLAIFSEGQPPIVAMMPTVRQTLELPCYKDFPESEKQQWLEQESPAALLAKHWLLEMRCDEFAHTDTSFCACGQWRSEPQPNVGEAAKRWAEHALTAI